MRESFTLTETLVAISIIIIGLVAIVSLSLSFFSAAYISQQRATANDLSREGMETVRSIRDSNWLDPSKDWNNGLTCNAPCIDDPVTPTCCFRVNFDIGNKPILEEVNPNGGLIQNCQPDCRLCLVNGRYIPCHGQPTAKDIYWRMIKVKFVTKEKVPECWKQVESLEVSECYEITSEIFWSARFPNQLIKLESILTNWR